VWQDKGKGWRRKKPFYAQYQPLGLRRTDLGYYYSAEGAALVIAKVRAELLTTERARQERGVRRPGAVGVPHLRPPSALPLPIETTRLLPTAVPSLL
jgi:hypothetical protein